jgi:hypothetical protein
MCVTRVRFLWSKVHFMRMTRVWFLWSKVQFIRMTRVWFFVQQSAVYVLD